MQVKKSLQIQAPAKEVWIHFYDWGNVWRFQPWVVRSPLLTNIEEGVGASRRCEFSDNTSIVETITKVVSGKRIEFSLSETAKPMTGGTGYIDISERGPKSTLVEVGMDVTLGLGPLNPVMGLMMKPMMRTRITKMIESLGHHIQTGGKLDPKGNKLTVPAEMPHAKAA